MNATFVDVLPWYQQPGGLGTDEIAEELIELGTDETLDVASSALDSVLGAADDAVSAIGDAVATGADTAITTANSFATDVLGGISNLLKSHANLLIAIVNAGVATYTIYQRVQGEIAAARQKKDELADQLSALRERFTGGGVPAGGSTTITVAPGAATMPGAPAATTPNYAAWGLGAALAVAVLAWAVWTRGR